MDNVVTIRGKALPTDAGNKHATTMFDVGFLIHTIEHLEKIGLRYIDNGDLDTGQSIMTAVIGLINASNKVALKAVP